MNDFLCCCIHPLVLLFHVMAECDVLTEARSQHKNVASSPFFLNKKNTKYFVVPNVQLIIFTYWLLW